MIKKDEKEHAGRDEATVYLVKQLQADCENEIKSEEQEPYKYDEKDFPALGSKQQSKGNGNIIINQNQNNLGLNQYLKLSAKAYKDDLMNILKDESVIPLSRENCSYCDPRFKLIFSPEKSRNNLLLEKQISFQSNKIEFR